MERNHIKFLKFRSPNGAQTSIVLSDLIRANQQILSCNSNSLPMKRLKSVEFLIRQFLDETLSKPASFCIFSFNNFSTWKMNYLYSRRMLSIKESQTRKRPIISCLEYLTRCVVAGTGLLQIPYALSQMGWLGILVLIFLAIVNVYTSSLLIKSLQSHSLVSFPEVGRRVFGNAGGFMVSLFYGTALGGSVCLYLILAGLNFETMLGIFTQTGWIIVLSTLLLLLLLSVKSLKEVGALSFLGVVTAVAVVALVCIGSYKDFDNYAGTVEHKLLALRSFGSVLGTLCFSFGGNYVYPEIYHEMQNKNQFTKVLAISISIISMLYLATGVSGYATYGNMAVSPIFISLPNGIRALTRSLEK